MGLYREHVLAGEWWQCSGEERANKLYAGGLVAQRKELVSSLSGKFTKPEEKPQNWEFFY